MYNARIIEHGNGFPDVGDMVYHGQSDQLYRVVESSRIHTGGGGGQGNYCYARVVARNPGLSARQWAEVGNYVVELFSDDDDK